MDDVDSGPAAASVSAVVAGLVVVVEAGGVGSVDIGFVGETVVCCCVDCCSGGKLDLSCCCGFEQDEVGC